MSHNIRISARHTMLRLLALVAMMLVGAMVVVAHAQSGGQANKNAGRDADKGSDKNNDKRRPKVTLRAQPSAAVAPARIVFTVDISGGADDFEEFYCPTIEWDWDDETTSETTTDCEPYEAGRTHIKRRYTVQHQYKREGAYRVYFHMKRNDKILASASANVRLQPGLSSPY